jgi:hypothetical protein
MSVDANDGQLFGNLDVKLSGGRENAESNFVRVWHEDGVHPLEHREVVKRTGSLGGAVSQAMRGEVIAGARECVLQPVDGFTIKPAVGERCDHGNFFQTRRSDALRDAGGDKAQFTGSPGVTRVGVATETEP